MTIYLSDLFDDDLLADMYDRKLVRSQVHPNLPLEIINYTELAQFSQTWNEVTLNCRGLIYNYETGAIVARPWEKFFNWDDSSRPYPPNGPVLRSPKMDGSLGILYVRGRNDDHSPDWAVATRGSFTSDQALWATRQLDLELSGNGIDLDDLDTRKTYLCEIIYPGNRIVVDYGAQERLVLLDVVDTETGKSDLEEFDRVYWLDKVERKYFPGGFSDGFVHDIPEGEEGFVIYWPGSNYRVKMKAAEYLELHRMIFSLSERSVWARMTGSWRGEGETVSEIAQKLPDEFHEWVNKVGVDLAYKLDEIERQAKADLKSVYRRMDPEYYNGAPLTDARRQDRKAFAAEAVKYPTRAYLFMLHDGKDIKDAIWKTLRPEGNKGVVTISEDVA